MKVASGAATNLFLQARYYLGLSNALDDNVYDSKSQDFSDPRRPGVRARQIGPTGRFP